MRHTIVSIMIVTTIINMVACSTPESEPEPSLDGQGDIGYTNTLSGAFKIDSYIEEALISYNNHYYKISEHYKDSNTNGFIHTFPQDSNTLLLNIHVEWNDTTVDFYIDSIPLKGEPYNVTISTIINGDIILSKGSNTIISNEKPIEVNGYIKRLNHRPPKSRTSYVDLQWDCNLTLKTDIVDVPFELHIESISDTEF